MRSSRSQLTGTGQTIVPGRDEICQGEGVMLHTDITNVLIVNVPHQLQTVSTNTYTHYTLSSPACI